MKKLMLLALALALPLIPAAQADNNNRKGRHPAPSDDSSAARFETAKQQGVQNIQRQNAQRSRALYPPQRVSTATRGHNTAAQNRPAVYRRGNPPVTTRATANRLSRNGDRTQGNRNFNRNSFAAARGRVVHTRHDRGWWRSHYNTTFVLFGGGYYYWDTGYWYPAYGYDPYYNNYVYDEPIYGYNDLAPGQVLENVQLALRDEGYYRGAIDGLIGPQTRAALAAFQRDNGLVETAAVDEPTLVTLGLA